MDEILSVSALTAEIKKQLEPKFSAIQVKGEVSNLKEQTSGHLYFTLKDQAAQISRCSFSGQCEALTLAAPSKKWGSGRPSRRNQCLRPKRQLPNRREKTRLPRGRRTPRATACP